MEAEDVFTQQKTTCNDHLGFNEEQHITHSSLVSLWMGSLSQGVDSCRCDHTHPWLRFQMDTPTLPFILTVSEPDSEYQGFQFQATDGVIRS